MIIGRCFFFTDMLMIYWRSRLTIGSSFALKVPASEWNHLKGHWPFGYGPEQFEVQIRCYSDECQAAVPKVSPVMRIGAMRSYLYPLIPASPAIYLRQSGTRKINGRRDFGIAMWKLCRCLIATGGETNENKRRLHGVPVRQTFRLCER